MLHILPLAGIQEFHVMICLLAVALLDTSGKEIFENWEKRLAASASLAGELVVTGGGADDRYRFRFSKPNLVEVLQTQLETHADGTAKYYYWPDKKEYIAEPPEQGLPRAGIYFGLGAFFDRDSNYTFARSGEAKFEGQDTYTVVLGQKAGRITAIGKAAFQGEGLEITLYFAKSGQPLGFTVPLPTGDVKGVYSKLENGAAKPASTFAWRPPEGAKPSSSGDYDKGLLPVGSTAPDIDLQTVDGSPKKLSEYVKGRKATLVNFYFVGCVGCMIEFPNLDTLYRNHQRDGLGIVAIDPIDEPKTVKDYYRSGGFKIETLLKSSTGSDVAKAYGVVAYPTNYILDRDMKIVARYSGEYQNRTKAKLRELGIPIPK
jgi:peroxiredoxin/outer membrane lipoprotein-sorting protein